jgi:MannoseP isomerase/GMP-like beta-helix domain
MGLAGALGRSGAPLRAVRLATARRVPPIIFDARTKNRTPVAVVGLRDSILVQTEDAVLLAHKSQSQKIKEMVKKLAEDPRLKKLV